LAASAAAERVKQQAEMGTDQLIVEDPRLGIPGELGYRAAQEKAAAEAENMGWVDKFLGKNKEAPAAASKPAAASITTKPGREGIDVIDFNKPVNIRYGVPSNDRPLPTTPAARPPDSTNIAPTPFPPAFAPAGATNTSTNDLLQKALRAFQRTPFSFQDR
jgi:hypothetical protein